MKTVVRKLLLVCGLASVAMLGFAQDVKAQQAQGGQADAVEYDQGTIDRFADAYQEIVVLQQRYSEQIQAAGGQEEAQALQQEAQQEMIGAVEGAGLTVEEYNGIIEKAQNDPAFAERVQSKTGQ